MADQTLQVRIEGDLKNLQAALTQAKNDLGQFSEKVESESKKVDSSTGKLRDALGRFVKQVGTDVKTAGVSIGDFGDKISKESKKAEASLGSIQGSGLDDLKASLDQTKNKVGEFEAKVNTDAKKVDGSFDSMNASATGALKGIETAFQTSGNVLKTYELKHKKVSDGLSESVRKTNEYELTLSKLNSELQSGVISEEKYSKAAARIKDNISKGREETTAWQRELKRLNSEMNLIKPADGISKPFVKAGGIIDQLRTKLKKLKTNLESATDIKSIAKYNVRIEQTQAELQRLTNISKTSSNQVANANKKVEGSFDSLNKVAIGALKGIAAAFTVRAIVQFGKAVVDTTAEFQKFQAVLSNTLGSDIAATVALRDLSEFASRTPFQVDELTNSFVKLTNQGFKPVVSELRKLGDLASSTGKTFDQLAEAIIDAQVSEFERLKEFGIRAQKSGDQVTFTFKGVQTQVKNTSEEIRGYILALGDAEGVSGSMAKISETTGGKISNLTDTITQLKKEIGDGSSGLISGVLDLANSLAGQLVSSLNSVNIIAQKTSEGGLVSFLKQISAFANPLYAAGLKGQAELIKAYDKAAVEAAESVGKLADEEVKAFNTLKSVAEDASLHMDKRIEAIKELQSRYPDYIGKLTKEQLLTGKVGDSYDQLSNSINSKSKAQSFSNTVEENSIKLKKLDNQLLEKQTELAKARTAALNASPNQSFGIGQDLSGKKALSEAKVRDILKEQLDIENKIAQINSENVDLKDKIAESIKESSNFIVPVKVKLSAEEYKKALEEFSKTATRLNEDVFRKGKEDADSYNQSLIETNRILEVIDKAYQNILSNKTVKTASFDIDGNLIEGSEKMINLFKKEVEDLGNFLDGVNLNVEIADLDESSKTRFLESLRGFNDEASQILESGIENLIGDLAFSIGDSLANGANAFEAGGKVLLSGLANIMNQLGQSAIGVGVTIKSIKVALKSLNPAIAIGAGVALIALAGFVSSKVKGLGGGGSGGGGGGGGASSGFSGGGVGTSFTNAVAPTSPGFSSIPVATDFQNNIIVYGRLDGNDILLSSQRSAQKNSWG